MTQQHPPPNNQSSSGQFVNEAMAKLRLMLQLLQQNEWPNNRRKVLQISMILTKMGTDYHLPQWTELLESCSKAIAFEQNSPQILINVVIKEIKQALELILKGQGKAIKISANLQAILPREIKKQEIVNLEGQKNQQFVNEAMAKLRLMLQLLQQNELPNNRQKVRHISMSLIQLGTDYHLPEWTELLESCSKAIAFEQNSPQVLINVVIKEIKQALELILKGQSKSIKISANLQTILPREIKKQEIVNLDVETKELTELESLFSEGEHPAILPQNISPIFAELEALINQPVASILFAELEKLINKNPPKKLNINEQNQILIVDDSIGVRELLSITFTKAGYKVQQARDGQDAWEKLQSGLMFNMILCDIEMPRMNGFQLLECLQNDDNFNQIPVAMLTSRSSDKHKKTALQFGAKGYFTKPYLEDVLLNAAARIIQGENLFNY
ncbi:MAG TPA: response regulator [Allocoleopsis sp.]